jgi:hypothetical protein
MFPNALKTATKTQADACAVKSAVPAYSAPKLFVGGNTLDLVQRAWQGRYTDYGWRSSFQGN